MKHFFVPFLAAILFLSGCTNCLVGSGDVSKQKRSVEEFDVIEINGSMEVQLKQANNGVNTIEVRAQENLLDNIKTDVHGARLVIDALECMQSTSPIIVEVTLNDLKKIIHDGSGDLTSIGVLRFEEIKLIFDGSGDIQLKSETEELVVSHDGSGDVRLSGNTQRLELDLDGSGDIDAMSLKSLDADITNDGSGKVSFFATEKISMDLTGSGDIEYKGEPQDFAKEVTGSGSIRNMN